MSLPVLYTLNYPSPRELVLDEDNPLDLRVEVDGAAGTPSSASVLVKNGATTLATVTPSISGGTMTATITAAHLSGRALWDVVDLSWEFTLSGNVEHYPDSCLIVPVRWRCAVAVSDLTRRYGDLLTCLPAGMTTLSPCIEEAHREVRLRLVNEGMDRHPSLMLTMEAPRLPTMHLALAITFRNMGTAQGRASVYMERAAYHEEQYEQSWKAMRATFRPRDSTQWPNGVGTNTRDDSIGRPLSLTGRDPYGQGRF